MADVGLMIPPGWEIADPRIGQHVAILEQNNITVFNWLNDPRVPRLLNGALEVGTEVKLVKVDNLDTFSRFSVPKRVGPSIDALDAVRSEYIDRINDLIWSPGAKWPQEIRSASIDFMNMCPTGEALVEWALDYVARQAEARVA